MKNIAAVTIAERPVLPPTATPAEDSTKVVTVEVPQTAPVQVEHRAIHIRHGLLALFVLDEQIAAAACAVQRAERVKHIDHAERQRGGGKCDDQAADGVPLACEVTREVKALGKYLAERFRGKG